MGGVFDAKVIRGKRMWNVKRKESLVNFKEKWG
jgi:hypothetical protein